MTPVNLSAKQLSLEYLDTLPIQHKLIKPISVQLTYHLKQKLESVSNKIEKETPFGTFQAELS